MIKVTFEYATVDEAIVALAKLVGAPGQVKAQPKAVESLAPGAPTFTRRGRSDKGQARGSYKNPQQNANAANVSEATTVAATAIGTGVADTAGQGTTDPRTAAVSDAAQQPTSTTPNPVVLAPEPAAPAQEVGSAPGATEKPAAAAPVYTQKDVQEAVATVFKTKGLPVALQVLQRFGANTYRDVLPASYAEFINHATFVSEGGQV